MKNDKVGLQTKLIGLGGIGSWLATPLAQTLAMTVSGARLMLIDGDEYEEANRERQLIPGMENKAEAWASRLRPSFKELVIAADSRYIDEGTVTECIREGDTVFLCVDNHWTRKVVSDRCQELENTLLISGGNELTTGNVQVYVREGGKDLTLPLASVLHDEIRFPASSGPTAQGCLAQLERAPQLLIMNFHIAALMLNALYAVQAGKLGYDEVNTDIIANATVPFDRSEYRRP